MFHHFKSIVMIKKIICAILCCLCFILTATGQNYQKEFYDYFQSNDTVNQLKVLKKWSSAQPDNPELFTSFFNYYIMNSRKEIVMMSMKNPEKEALVLIDSLGQEAAYMTSRVTYEPVVFQKGIDIINEGIQKHPDRLDMRFGKTYALGQVEDWKLFTDEIIKAIKHSKSNDMQWTWTNNSIENAGKNFFLSAIQDYQVQLYNTGDDQLLNNMRSIALEILKIYPDDVVSLSNLSITHMLQEDFEKAVESLLKAEKLNPLDTVVINNIAQCYKLQGMKKKAIEYYEKLLTMDDDASKEFAIEQIATLKKE